MGQVGLTQRLNDKKAELKENRTTMDRSQAEHDKLRLEDVEYVGSPLFRFVSHLLAVTRKTRNRTSPREMTAVKTKTGVKARSRQLAAGKERTPTLL